MKPVPILHAILLTIAALFVIVVLAIAVVTITL